MKTTAMYHQHSLVSRLLSTSALVAILLSLVVPGMTAAAQNPFADSYIIVFKDSADPTAEAVGLAKAYGLRRALSTGMP